MAVKITQITGVLFLIAFATCQISNELDADDVEKKLKENFPGFENFNRSSLPSTENVEKALKEKCEKAGGGEEAYNAFINQQESFKNCFEEQINVTQIQIEIEEAKKTGSMDEVFGKYCKKYPDIKICLNNVTESVKPCLEPAEIEAIDKAKKLADDLRDFVCFKDGDRLAMFIAEGGVDCLQSRKDEVQECANKTIGSRIPTDFSVDSLPKLIFTERDCRDFDTLRKCINTELEKCKDSTPANIVDAFFKFLKKQLPCEKSVPPKAESKTSLDNTSSAVSVTSSLLVFTSVFIFRWL